MNVYHIDIINIIVPDNHHVMPSPRHFHPQLPRQGNAHCLQSSRACRNRLKTVSTLGTQKPHTHGYDKRRIVTKTVAS